MTALIASVLVVLLVGIPAFKLGQAWEHVGPQEEVDRLPRHPSHHHRTTSGERRRQRHLRLMTPPYDFDREASA